MQASGPQMVRYVPHRPEPALGGDLLFSLAVLALLLYLCLVGGCSAGASEGQACSRTVACPPGLECRAGRCQKPHGCVACVDGHPGFGADPGTLCCTAVAP